MNESFYQKFFEQVTGYPPLPWQKRLAIDAERPNALDIPTGLGKTAGVVVDWLARQLVGEAAGKRLVMCLPMRTLVEQCNGVVGLFITRASAQFAERGIPLPRVHVLMGGEIDDSWILCPDKPVILIGTQDLLLSRALMRGYGMNPFQWPIHFGLLHNDAEWVFDEIQLMGPGLTTAAQLEAFRRRLGTAKPCRSLWISATLRPDWLATVDLHPILPAPVVSALDSEDRANPLVKRRVEAVKRLHATHMVVKAFKKADEKAALEELAHAIHAAHVPGSQTIVFLNSVSRAQQLHGHLKSVTRAQVLLIHSRFRPAERANLALAMAEDLKEGGRILVSTQALEAGVDVSSRTMFTELAPWPSLVQRFGRCNRYGEFDDGADIHWIDVDDESAQPYEAAQLADARQLLGRLSNAAVDALPPVGALEEGGTTLRQRDLLGLFNTDPDLSGFELDISGYIRDTDETDAFAFWRTMPQDANLESLEPCRDELCRVPVGGLRELLKRKDVESAWLYDRVESRWKRQPAGMLALRVRPGQTVMLDAAKGGYSADSGFHFDGKTPVPVIQPDSQLTQIAEGHGDDPTSRLPQAVLLAGHLSHVESAALELAKTCDDQAHELLALAARWHDTGKAHPIFQQSMNATGEETHELWAKSTHLGRHSRKGFRHEVVSMLLWLEGHQEHPMRDLVAFLVLAHHGKVRLSLRALPGEIPPPHGGLHARGVWEGDRTPAFLVADEAVPEQLLRLDLMQLGHGSQGPSWRQRSEDLVKTHGPFRLAWWEALLRIADWRASAAEATTPGREVQS